MTRKLPQSELVIVHLSDIHFRKEWSANIENQEHDIRNELERDLRNLCPRISRVSAILITGDIAFSGNEDEFKLAKNWISRICELVECQTVLVTPGNHDVARPVAEIAFPICQRILALPDITAQCQELEKCLRDPGEGEALLASLAEYNKFAEQYGCKISRTMPFWEKTLAFPDSSNLLIRGLTTTILSNEHDDDDTNAKTLLYGEAQRTLLRKDGMIRVVVGHHPPSWNLDGDLAAQAFTQRTVLQMFGHEHDQWIDPGENCIRIYSGAVHPSPEELNWVPRYNVIGISRRGLDCIDIHLIPRRWTRDFGRFMADFDPGAREYRSKRVRIPAE